MQGYFCVYVHKEQEGKCTWYIQYAVYCSKIAEATLKNERTSSLEGNGNWTKTEMGDYLHVYDGRRDCIQSRLELFRD